MTDQNEALLAALPDAEDEALTSQEIMMHLDDEGRERFVKLQETFETEGWVLLKEWCVYQANVAGVKGANAETWEDCKEQKGRRMAWLDASNMAETFIAQNEQVAREAIEAAEDEALTSGRPH